jgi:hypothetical protein
MALMTPLLHAHVCGRETISLLASRRFCARVKALGFVLVIRQLVD